ncbi:hypothetical protein [Schlesneria paludicola]|uniref:hypothetical protein n=1 Tax=Schlesneria paludicola TaxID=360056 RepID=UPI00029AB0A5|nr:hypothetical protein [Schlesneria paludicola]
MRIRLIAGAMALVCLAATFKIVSLGSHLRLTATIPALLGLAFLAFAIGPSAWTKRITAVMQTLHRAIARADWEPPRMLVVALAVCGIALGLWGLQFAWQVPTNPDETDQGAYLATASQIQADGGLFALMRRLYSGEFHEANRHPFYLGLLSLSPTQTWGKILSTIAVIIAIAGTAAILSCRSSLLASVLFLIWCSVNPALLKSATMIGCEAWLMVWIAISWWILDIRPPADGAANGDHRRTLGRTLGAGLSLGLGWLTKGTALPLLPLTACWLGFREFNTTRRALFGLIATLVFGCGWLASAHPLLIRNVRAFHSPFHNVNSWLLFVDAFEDPVELSQNRRLGDLAQDYVRSHTIGELVGREANGLVWESFILLRLLGAGPSNLSRAISGTLVLLLALLGASLSGRCATQLVLIWTIMLVPLFAWYIPIAADDRFLVPFAPIWIAYAAEGAARLLSAWFMSRAVHASPKKVGQD